MSAPTCCPHCKGQNGYEFAAKVIMNMVGSWGDDEPEWTHNLKLTERTIPRCVDCGKRVPGADNGEGK